MVAGVGGNVLLTTTTGMMAIITLVALLLIKKIFLKQHPHVDGQQDKSAVGTG